MIPRLQRLKDKTLSGHFRQFRSAAIPDLVSECQAEDLGWMQRMTRLTRRMCEAETVVLDADELIVFTRSVPRVPDVWSSDEWESLTHGRHVHEGPDSRGIISNICADWSLLLSQGLVERRRLALALENNAFGRCVADCLDAVLDLATRYAEEASRQGMEDVARILRHVPAYPARTFHEALQSLRLVHSCLWLSGHYHVCLGRFDQYMWPYLNADLEQGRLDRDGAQELLCEFFMSLNRDSDMYPGVQRGDNGQSLMLGGCRADGTDGVNLLTRLCLETVAQTAMIDPKINLRITKDMDLELLVVASGLTRMGLGFPQYTNDEVVIPALQRAGYELEDARDYTVAACWEFIIPGKGMELVNTGAVSLPACVDQAIRASLGTGESWEQLLQRVRMNIDQQTEEIIRPYAQVLLAPAPLYSAFMCGCLEDGRDVSEGLKYNNLGIHGAASANAVDALAAVHHMVYEKQRLPAQRLLQALENNWQNEEELRSHLLEYCPKTGNHDPQVDQLLNQLFNMLTEACHKSEALVPGRRIRAGSGSAMFYLWMARGNDRFTGPVVHATADGRRAGDFFSANLAPSPGIRTRGPLSVMQSFSCIDYQRVCNGGPLTMELSAPAFAHADGREKIARLVRTFARTGCQQLQLNVLDARKLEDARRHPEKHRDLIVRVWGWSGYFVELEPEYQEHVISRCQYEDELN